MDDEMSGSLGIGQRQAGKKRTESVDVSTRLAQERTDLALDRTYLAHERTLEAWVRTALSMISFGFTLGKLIQALRGDRMEGVFGRHEWSITSLAYFLVVVGVGALVAATVQHWFRVHALYAMGLRRRFSIAFVVALLVSAVGAFAFTALVLKL